MIKLHQQEMQGDSADDQIDSFLIKFENESLVAPEDLVMESLRKMTLRVLLEQPSPEKEAEDAEGEGVADAPEEEFAADTDKPVGSENQRVEEPSDEPVLPIDIDSFSKELQG